jgi:hypothetical protein
LSLSSTAEFEDSMENKRKIIWLLTGGFLALVMLATGVMAFRFFGYCEFSPLLQKHQLEDSLKLIVRIEKYHEMEDTYPEWDNWSVIGREDYYRKYPDGYQAGFSLGMCDVEYFYDSRTKKWNDSKVQRYVDKLCDEHLIAVSYILCQRPNDLQ